jgi:hypothetical protein
MCTASSKKVTKSCPDTLRINISLREITASNLKAETNHTAWVCKGLKSAARVIAFNGIRQSEEQVMWESKCRLVDDSGDSI